jgi:hypothetical protein
MPRFVYQVIQACFLLPTTSRLEREVVENRQQIAAGTQWRFGGKSDGIHPRNDFEMV